jgi:uncharacterized protein (UPF0548 family)
MASVDTMGAMTRSMLTSLGARTLSYPDVGGTAPRDDHWDRPSGYRTFEQTVDLGHGRDVWEALTPAVLRWEVKMRSGFTVEPHVAAPVQTGDRFWLYAHLGPVTVREPACVVAVVATDDRHGFAYGTLEGHPVSGEEASSCTALLMAPCGSLCAR